MSEINKAAFQFLVLVALFFTSWFLLSKIDFTGKLEVEAFSKRQEKKLGDLLLEGLKRTKDEISDDSVNKVVQDIRNRLCRENAIDSLGIRVVVLEADEVNALALPGNTLVVFTGLIGFCKSPEELAGVMAHEVAHIHHGHVMKKLVKEVGFAVLAAIIGGNGSFEVISEVLKTISSRAFDREQETEADMEAVHILTTAGIDPSGLSDFLFRLSRQEMETDYDFTLLSTHPDSADRAAKIMTENKKHPRKYKPLDIEEWNSVKESVSEID